MKLAKASLKGKRRENEEAIGGDALQHIDVLMLEATAEFQFVTVRAPSSKSRCSRKHSHKLRRGPVMGAPTVV